MRLLIGCAMVFLLSIAPVRAQDAPDCGGVAFTSDGAFSASWGYADCDEAKRQAIEFCETVTTVKGDCANGAVARRNTWIRIDHCVDKDGVDAKVHTGDTVAEMMDAGYLWVEESRFLPHECRTTSEGLIHTGGKHTNFPETPNAVIGKPLKPAARSSVWLAAASGFGKVAGRDVRVGFAQGNSKEQAEAAALKSCHDRSVRCDTVHAVNSGCLYIVPGKKPRAVTWGRGITKEIALTKCRDEGYTCRMADVIGGCVD